MPFLPPNNSVKALKATKDTASEIKRGLRVAGKEVSVLDARKFVPILR